MPSGSTNEGTTESGGEGQATLLVSEFPPPPYYFPMAAASNTTTLPPPPIPHAALKHGTERAAQAAALARQQQQTAADSSTSTDTILGGGGQHAIHHDNDDANNNNNKMVAVFGEIVEDPYLVVPPDGSIENPQDILNAITELNGTVLRNFQSLVMDLVHQPQHNVESRAALTNNIVQMIQHVNQFREHQARELLIQLLEAQLHQRQQLLVELQKDIVQADQLLS